MANVIPIKAIRVSNTVVGLGEFQSGDVVDPSTLPTVVARTDVSKTFTTQQVPHSGSLADASSIAWDCDANGQVVNLTTAASRTFAAPTNVKQNALYTLVLTTGGFTPAWNAAYKWPSGGTPSGLVSGVYVFTFVGGAGNTLIPTGPGYLTGA